MHITERNVKKEKKKKRSIGTGSVAYYMRDMRVLLHYQMVIVANKKTKCGLRFGHPKNGIDCAFHLHGQCAGKFTRARARATTIKYTHTE